MPSYHVFCHSKYDGYQASPISANSVRLPGKLITLRFLWSCILALFTSTSGIVYGQTVEIEGASRYLESVYSDESWSWSPGTPTELVDTVTTFEALASAAELRELQQSSEEILEGAGTFASLLNTNEARQIAWASMLLFVSDESAGLAINSTISMQNGDGGWAISNGRQSSVRDTADVILALHAFGGHQLDQVAMQNATHFLCSQGHAVTLGVGTASPHVEAMYWTSSSENDSLERFTQTAKVVRALSEIARRSDGAIDVAAELAAGKRYLERAVNPDDNLDDYFPVYSFESLGVYGRAAVLRALVPIGDPAIYGPAISEIIGLVHEGPPDSGIMWWTDTATSGTITDVLTTAEVLSLLAESSVPPNMDQPDLVFADNGVQISYIQPGYGNGSVTEYSSDDVMNYIGVPEIIFDFTIRNQGMETSSGLVADDGLGVPSTGGLDVYYSVYAGAPFGTADPLFSARILDPYSATPNVLAGDAEGFPSNQDINYTLRLFGIPCDLSDVMGIALDAPPSDALYDNMGTYGVLEESDESNNFTLADPDFSMLLPYFFVPAANVDLQWSQGSVANQTGLALEATAICLGSDPGLDQDWTVTATFVFDENSGSNDYSETIQIWPTGLNSVVDMSSNTQELAEGSEYSVRVDMKIEHALTGDGILLRGQTVTIDIPVYTSLTDLKLEALRIKDAASSTTLTAAELYPNRKVTIEVDIKNAHPTEPVGDDFETYLFGEDPVALIDGDLDVADLGEPLETITHTGTINPGQTATLIFGQSTDVYVPYSGNMAVWVDSRLQLDPNGINYVLSSSGDIDETDESNNLVVVDLPSDNEEPDLLVLPESVQLSGTDLAFSPVITVSAIVGNYGATLSDDCPAEVLFTATLNGGDSEVQTLGLGPQSVDSPAVRPVEFTWVPGEAGSWEISVEIRLADAVECTATDTNPSNNIVTLVQPITHTSITAEYSPEFIASSCYANFDHVFSMTSPFFGDVCGFDGIEIDVVPNPMLGPPLAGESYYYLCELVSPDGDSVTRLSSRGHPEKFILPRLQLGQLRPSIDSCVSPPDPYNTSGGIYPYTVRATLVGVDAEGNTRVVAEHNMLKLHIGPSVVIQSVYALGPQSPVGSSAFNEIFVDDGAGTDSRIRLGIASVVSEGLGSPVCTLGTIVLEKQNADQTGYEEVTATIASSIEGTDGASQILLQEGRNSAVVAKLSLSASEEPVLDSGTYRLRIPILSVSPGDCYGAEPDEDDVAYFTFDVSEPDYYSVNKRVRWLASDGVRDDATNITPVDGERVRVEITIKKVSD